MAGEEVVRLGVDVVVVGGGAAGCAAAISAYDEGVNVVLLEKESAEEAGGNTRVSGGAWFDNRDAERAAAYLRALCGDRPLPEPIVRTWAEQTRHISGWIESIGGKVEPTGSYPPEYPETAIGRGASQVTLANRKLSRRRACPTGWDWPDQGASAAIACPRSHQDRRASPERKHEKP